MSAVSEGQITHDEHGYQETEATGEGDDETKKMLEEFWRGFSTDGLYTPVTTKGTDGPDAKDPLDGAQTAADTSFSPYFIE